MLTFTVIYSKNGTMMSKYLILPRSAEDFVVIKEEYIIKKNTQNEINKDSNNNNNNVPQINNNSMNNFNSSYGKISTNQSSIDKDLRHSSGNLFLNIRITKLY